MSSIPRKERDLRIDFFRGLALIFIFIDHVPDNSWAMATLKNFGFADSSEVFVLLAGYSAGLAYWSIEERGGFRAVLSRASRRASEIYIWHLGVFIVSALLLYTAARVFHNPSYVNNIAMAELATDPLRTAISALALFYQPNQMNILPMYVVLMLWLPVVIQMLRWNVALALMISFGIWLVANLAGLNLPAHQRGEGWFFNPFAWQLLFTTGVAASVLARRIEARPQVEMRPRAEIVVPLGRLPRICLHCRRAVGANPGSVRRAPVVARHRRAHEQARSFRLALPACAGAGLPCGGAGAQKLGVA